ncbi:hypothetical protein [Neptunicella sp. SCSIO 80796]|uniref:hypothetical protein n=1 Tax=Neptunicella plasticusilytica TaxID=3117012 RepID=UPI003A4E46E8
MKSVFFNAKIGLSYSIRQCYLAGGQTQVKIMANDNKSYFSDQRHKGKDLLYRLMVLTDVLAWALFVAAMAVFHFARPEMETGFNRFLDVNVREGWNHSLIGWLVWLLVFCVGMSLLMIVIRSRRARRKTDALWVNIFFLIIAASASLAYLLLYVDMDIPV